MNAHEIDYVIYGEEMQYVEIELDPQGQWWPKQVVL